MSFRGPGHRPGRIGHPTEVRPGSDTFPDCHHQTRVEDCSLSQVLPQVGTDMESAR